MLQRFEQRSGGPIQHQRCVRMPLENRAGNHRVDRTVDAIPDRDCFALVRHTANNLPRLHDAMDRHADRVRRNFIHRPEPSLANLLFATSFIELDNVIRRFGLEIRRWVVERKMRILSNSNHCHIDRASEKLIGRFGTNLFWIRQAIKVVEGSQRYPINESLFQVPAERRGMVFADPDIFIKMKRIDLGPIDPGFFDQAFEDFELARTRCNNHSRFALLSNATSKNHRCEFGRVTTHAGPIRLNDDIDDTPRRDNKSKGEFDTDIKSERIAYSNRLSVSIIRTDSSLGSS